MDYVVGLSSRWYFYVEMDSLSGVILAKWIYYVVVSLEVLLHQRYYFTRSTFRCIL